MLLFMIIVGLAVVYLPAKRAEKINPIDALRRE
jgi:ABC-type antimicrobial peptide transport system permease subunit